MVYLILGAGFEEAEAIVPCDLLRRAGVEVRLAGIGGTDIPGSHGIPVHADCAAEAAELTKADMLILPGGLGGVRSIRGCEPVLCAAREMAQAGKWVAAICAAPTVLAELGLLEGPPRHLLPRHGAGNVRGRHAECWRRARREFHHGPRRRKCLCLRADARRGAVRRGNGCTHRCAGRLERGGGIHD